MNDMRAASEPQLATIVAGLSALPNQERTVAINVALARARVQLERHQKQTASAVVVTAAPARALAVVAPAVVVPPSAPPLAKQVFTEQEQTNIQRLYSTATWPDLLALAPGRSRQQIMSWAANRGLKRTKEAKSAAQSQATKGKPKASSQKKERAPREVATPVLNARVSAKTKSPGLTPMGRMLEEMRKLLPSHPRRMAYALAARTGTGQDAYLAWKNWKPQPQAA